LAPEHPFPAAIKDCVTAYRALVSSVDPDSVVVAGDSAGGGASLSTVIELRDANDPLPACLYLLSPWTDLTGSGESISDKAAIDPMIDPQGIEQMATWYRGDYEPTHPGVSPLFADLTGLPPMLVQLGSDEVLLSDSTRLVDRAKAAGVEVELDVADGMWHVYQALAPVLPEARTALHRAATFINARTPSSATTIPV
jgi:acetyl esterase/lipase